MSTCAVPGCESSFKMKQGYCNKHYVRFLRHGDPLGGRPVFHGQPMEYIRAVVLNYDGDDCLTWPFYIRSDGRGQVRFRGRDQLASRVVCILAHGEPPSPTHHAAHSCGKGHLGCVAPSHLRWATLMENELDKIKHGTVVAGEKNGNSKLTRSQVQEIKSLSITMSKSKLALQFGVSKKTIQRAANDNIWPATRRDAS